jgi:hypothetical protein
VSTGTERTSALEARELQVQVLSGPRVSFSGARKYHLIRASHWQPHRDSIQSMSS